MDTVQILSNRCPCKRKYKNTPEEEAHEYCLNFFWRCDESNHCKDKCRACGKHAENKA